IRPVGHTGPPRSGAALKLKEAFWGRVVSFSNSMDKKAKLKMISELAVGRYTSSPFRSFVDGMWEDFDGLLREMGFFPDRKPEDRTSEIHCRRLRAWAAVVQHPDSKFLEGMAATGVAIGTRGEIPWVSAVYNKRDRKGPEDLGARWDEEEQQGLRRNYTSAKERMERVRTHVEADVKKAG
ncbi:Uncharacterized protein SCF082_LOCUS25335, partial [Durusdinium trenchii]